MRPTAIHLKTLITAASLICTLGLITPVVHADAATDAADIKKGKKLAFNKKKGNCLACHQIAGGKLPGNIGPPLVAMKSRFPDFEVLKAQITDSRVKNPNTIMPPFGPHGIISTRDIRMISKFIHTL
jgi:sulfur-oxidizing protein SoxX